MTTRKQKMIDEVPGVDEDLAEVVEAVHEGRPLRKVLGVEMGAIDVVLDNAHSLYERGSFDDAETLLEGVLALDDSLAYPHLLLGDVYRKSDRLEEAIEEFDAALEHADPENTETADVKLRAAEVEMELGRRDEARSRARDLVDAEEVDGDVESRARVLLESAGATESSAQ